jgi:transcriptional regulator with PAS, ATPase and Fis domain
MRLAVGAPGKTPGPLGTGPKDPSLPLNLREAEAILISRAMEASDGNVSAAAKLLGVNRTKLYRKLPTLQKG